jgi:hypothetical protein
MQRQSYRQVMDVENSQFQGNGTGSSSFGDEQDPPEEVDYTPLDCALPQQGGTGRRWGGVGGSTGAEPGSPHKQHSQWGGLIRSMLVGGGHRPQGQCNWSLSL